MEDLYEDKLSSKDRLAIINGRFNRKIQFKVLTYMGPALAFFLIMIIVLAGLPDSKSVDITYSVEGHDSVSIDGRNLIIDGKEYGAIIDSDDSWIDEHAMIMIIGFLPLMIVFFYFMKLIIFDYQKVKDEYLKKYELN